MNSSRTPRIAPLHLVAALALFAFVFAPAEASAATAYSVTIDGVSAKVEAKGKAKIEVKGESLAIELSAARESGKKTEFDLIIAGEKFTVEMGKKEKLRSKGESKRPFEVLVTRWYPTYAMGPIRFQHPEGATIDDDREETDRMASIEFEDDSIEVMDGRPEKDAKLLATMLARLTAAQLQQDGEWESVKAQKLKKVQFAKSSGWSARVHSVDDEGDTFVTDYHVLESRGNLIIVTLSCWGMNEAEHRERFRMVLDSIEFVPESSK